MKISISKKADADGWKAVRAGTKIIGHVCKIGGYWRARVGKTEHLGFETRKSAAQKLVSLAS